ncbi:16S rRNA m(2)G 1207 methyltransferase /23S rRNA m(2)G-1835 methyltransferase [Jatrophihabitans sp. GAS493]|uniref:class I SAM-dependent methyltransferase n=1 Tax=Jatrophihabitans sp. GAS493 TaxID=1907575 RepID=UPI000BB6CB25|nr:methyltransferase [Jatrophihabitans sp. GAS493]SOD70899.1 16S rRNA m(2)G 1207 methyltransferase /23S rRNA m(2)G-1835 methyltransferase [Jatrophihabitans sp. GAS493]
MTTFSLDALRRAPDIEAPNLFAVDATDRLLLDTAATAITALAPGQLAIVEDRYGALTLGAAALSGASGIRVHQDPLIAEQALARNASASGLSNRYRNLPLGEELLSDAKVVLLQAPKSLAALREIVELTARYADPSVTLYVGGRVKHLTLTMNQVLAEHFRQVQASLARQKSRLLIASHPIASGRLEAPFSYPERVFQPEIDLWVCASGAAFAGTKLDQGTRFLLQFIDHMLPTAGTAVDLGCGTGILAAMLAVARPDLAVIATDQSAAAVSSAEATVEANGLSDRIRVTRDDAMSELADGGTDLIVCNPPFHIGTSVQPRVAEHLFAGAGRVLRSGGELWTVYNSHLDYRPLLRRHVGPTRLVERNPKFSVTCSLRD